MTKTLSEQLCEICELERTQVTHNEQTKKTTYTKLKLDFEQPENFVKLLELPLKLEGKDYKTIGQYVYYHDSDFWSRESFLNILVYLLTACNIEDKLAIKQTIRYYDGWVWGQG